MLVILFRVLHTEAIHGSESIFPKRPDGPSRPRSTTRHGPQPAGRVSRRGGSLMVPGPREHEPTESLPAVRGGNEEDPKVSPLTFELPAVLHGLEAMVYERAARLSDPGDAKRFERTARMIAGILEHRILGWLEVGRIPSETNSPAAMLVAAGE